MEEQNNKGWKRVSGHGVRCGEGDCPNIHANYRIGGNAIDEFLCFPHAVESLSKRGGANKEAHRHYYNMVMVGTPHFSVPREIKELLRSEAEGLWRDADNKSRLAYRLIDEISKDHIQYIQEVKVLGEKDSRRNV